MNTIVIRRSRQFDDLLLLVGQTLAQVSDRMVQLGLIWFITSSFGENFLIWYLVVGGLPHALLVKHSSLVISRLSALKTVVYSDLARGFIYFIAFALISIFPEWLQPASGAIVLGVLFISVFSSNIFSAFFNPAILSLAVEIKDADGVQKLTAKLSTVSSFATILGPVLGLFVFNHFGLAGLFIITAICYLVSAYSVSLLSKPGKNDLPVITAPTATESTASLLDTKKIILVMLLVFLIMNLLLSPLQVLMPSMAKDLFGNSFNALAVLETVLGLGILSGGAILSMITIQYRPLFWTWIFLLALSLGYLLFTFSNLFGSSEFQLLGVVYKSGFLSAVAALLVMGLSLGLANVLIINILQTQPETKEVPKVMSLVNLISTAALPFSLALLGILQQFISITTLGHMAGVLLVAFVLVSYLTFRRFGQEIFK